MEVRRYAGLEALPRHYDALFQESERESFFNGALWYQALLAAASEPDDELRLYGLEENGSSHPLALLLTSSSPRVRGPCGARLLRGCQNVYTLQFSPLLSAECSDHKRAIYELIGAVAEERPRWDAISFAMMDRDSQVFEYLLAALHDSGMVTEPYFQFGNWYEDIDGRSFDAYLAARGKSAKKTLAWKARRFARRPDSSFEIYTGGEGLERAMAAFKKVYATSWKESERYPGFIDRLMRDCSDRGLLRLGNLYLEDEPVATWFVIVSHGTAIGFKTAYDPKIPSKLSVGGVLTYEVMKYLIDEEKVSRVDFGAGDEAYKVDWMSLRRERWGIMAYNRRTPRGALLAAMMRGRAWARNILRSGPAE
jgi:Acetyltransferase (GNAT) domain